MRLRLDNEGIWAFSVLLIGVGLAADCFAVALSSGISQRILSPLQVVRASFSFGLFQTLMPVLGWLAGRTMVSVIESYDHWVVFILLAFVGGRMTWESFHSRASQSIDRDMTKGILLLTLSVATSTDALAVGLTFAFLAVKVVPASLTIGAITFLISILGFLLGRKTGELIGRQARIVGGLVLFGIGLRILLTHLF